MKPVSRRVRLVRGATGPAGPCGAAGASPSGTFQITLQSETAGTSVTMKAGSWIRWRTI